MRGEQVALRGPSEVDGVVVEGGGPGAGLGATFIGYFVDSATPWAHLDIAGVNWADRPDAITPKGASGWGVRILDDMVRNWKK